MEKHKTEWKAKRSRKYTRPDILVELSVWQLEKKDNLQLKVGSPGSVGYIHNVNVEDLEWMLEELKRAIDIANEIMT